MRTTSDYVYLIISVIAILGMIGGIAVSFVYFGAEQKQVAEYSTAQQDTVAQKEQALALAQAKIDMATHIQSEYPTETTVVCHIDYNDYACIDGHLYRLQLLGYNFVNTKELFFCGTRLAAGNRVGAIYEMTIDIYSVYTMNAPNNDSYYYFWCGSSADEENVYVPQAMLHTTLNPEQIVEQYHVEGVLDDCLCRVQCDNNAQLIFDIDTITITNATIKRITFNMATLYTGEATDRYVLKADDITKHYIADGGKEDNILVIK